MYFTLISPIPHPHIFISPCKTSHNQNSPSVHPFIIPQKGNTDLKIDIKGLTLPPEEHVHLTQYELHGLKAIVMYLHALPTSKKCVPELITDPIALIRDVRTVVEQHRYDKPELAKTCKPVLEWWPRVSLILHNLAWYVREWMTCIDMSGRLVSLSHLMTSVPCQVLLFFLILVCAVSLSGQLVFVSHLNASSHVFFGSLVGGLFTVV